ncbi:MAG TPA: purine/pyrimidine permease [Desulfuromonadales bacterium]|nr:purine/pyrimidine permease [Desulfuromonadales bacterium]
MKFRYQLDERPPLRDLFLFGLQWLAISVPSLVIIGRAVAGPGGAEPAAEILYLQKLALVTGLTMGVQVLFGHRLPLVVGPAAVLLIGVAASRGYPAGVVYGSILTGGLVLTLLAVTGLFGRLVRLFTPRVVAAVLLLIAFTLLPTIRGLILAGGAAPPTAGLCFAAVLVLLLFIAQQRLAGIWKATLIVWGLLAGSGVWLLLFPTSLPISAAAPLALPAGDWAIASFAVDPGVLVAFLFCFLALAVNEMGSIQSMAALLNPADMPGRISRGVTVAGLGNMLAGACGVLGPVDFSLSPGVIAATGCASRFVLLPAALALVLLSFSPLALGILGAVPPVVVGATLLFILCSQVAAGLLTLMAGEEPFRFEHGLVIGLPLLLGTLVAFLPPAVVAGFPAALQPVLGNGFVVGTVTVLLLEHGLMKNSGSC